MARVKRVDEAVEVYRGLEASEVAPDCAMYMCVVGALCGAGRWSEAEDVKVAEPPL